MTCNGFQEFCWHIDLVTISNNNRQVVETYIRRHEYDPLGFFWRWDVKSSVEKNSNWRQECVVGEAGSSRISMTCTGLVVVPRQQSSIKTIVCDAESISNNAWHGNLRYNCYIFQNSEWSLQKTRHIASMPAYFPLPAPHALRPEPHSQPRQHASLVLVFYSSSRARLTEAYQHIRLLACRLRNSYASSACSGRSS